MAVLQNPLPGTMTGSIGNVVLYDALGQHRARSKPLKVTQPNTPQQLATQNRMKALGFLMSKLASFVNESYSLQVGPGEVGANVFVRENSANGAYDRNLVAAPWEPTPDLASLEISRGGLEGIIGVATTNTTPAAFALSWTDNTGANGALGTDEVWIVIIPETYETDPMSRNHKPIYTQKLNNGSITRDDAASGAINLATLGYVATDAVFVYLCAVRMTFIPYGVVQQVSDTNSFGSVTLT